MTKGIGSSRRRVPHRVGRRALVAFGSALAVVVGLSISPAPAAGDTYPPPNIPATVSVDPLPTVQIDGIVWKQARYGNTVYATGRFATARPAGVAPGGPGTVTRQNLLAYDITTGQLDTTFNHSLTGTNAEGRSIAVSPDGRRLYVGGTFTAADGQPRQNLAAFDLSTNALLGGFSGTNGRVGAIAATNTQVYVGGTFSTAGGQPRSRLAAYNSSGSLNTTWVANVSGPNVQALVVTPAQGNLVIGGSFNAINGRTYYSNGAVKLANGQGVTPWASQNTSFPIRLQPPAGQSATSLGITSLATDGTQVYLAAFTYVPGPRPTSFEGRAAISAVDGRLIWLNDCAGDTYDVAVVGRRIYSVGHPHNCSPIGGFPNQTAWRALAETSYVTGTNGRGMGGNYPNFQGQPRGSLLVWFPVLNAGTVTGTNQAAWSVVATDTYVALGGEFTRADGIPQQGLVRYGVRKAAPNLRGPYVYPRSGYAITATPATAAGESTVRTFVTGDPDNGRLTYEVYREGSTTPLASRVVDSRYWAGTSWTFVDQGLAPGKTAWYSLVVKDAFGNTRNVPQATAVDDTTSTITYAGSGWVSSQNRADNLPDFARGIHYTAVNGSSASYTFTGTSVSLISERNPERGTATVSIDGSVVATIDLSSTTALFNQVVFTQGGLAAGTHTIKVTKTGGPYIDIDAFVVRP